MNVQIAEMLHCTKGTSDKVWGYIKTRSGAIVFWGPRLSPSMQTQVCSFDVALDRYYKKLREGYKQAGARVRAEVESAVKCAVVLRCLD